MRKSPEDRGRNVAVDVICRLKSTGSSGTLGCLLFSTPVNLMVLILSTIQQSFIHENHNFIKEI